jgi:hypothetical protein
VTNEGAIYVATHGRGIFRSDLFLSTEDIAEDLVEAEAPALTVYPNPSTAGTFSWRTDAMRGDFRLEIFDLNGRVVRNEWVRGYAGGPVEVSIGDLMTGTYIVRLANKNAQVMSKLMVR